MRNLPGLGLPVPMPTDPAAGACALEALATAADAKLDDYDTVTAVDHPPTGIGSGGATGYPFAAGAETTCPCGNVEFDNANLVGFSGIRLPTTVRRWWWYVGATISLDAGAALNTRFTLRLAVDDTDPATGITATKVLKRTYYSPGNGPERLFLDWFVCSGGGRLRATVTHTHTASLDFADPCYLWATRLTPEV